MYQCLRNNSNIKCQRIIRVGVKKTFKYFHPDLYLKCNQKSFVVQCIIQAVGTQRQEDHKFKASLSNKASPCLKPIPRKRKIQSNEEDNTVISKNFKAYI
jgi:hypothetical protein